MNRFAWLAATWVALVISPIAANAALTGGDYLTAGDGLLTLDTAHGVEWLDWTATVGYSYDSFEATLASGGLYDGWRRATRADLDNLLQSAGVPDPHGRTVANIPSVTNIISLLGATNFFSFLGTGNSTDAMLAGSLGGTGDSAAFTIETFDNPVTAKAGEIGVTSHTFVFTDMGNAIIRDIPAAVPEPESYVMFLAGLGLLTFAARRRLHDAALG